MEIKNVLTTLVVVIRSHRRHSNDAVMGDRKMSAFTRGSLYKIDDVGNRVLFASITGPTRKEVMRTLRATVLIPPYAMVNANGEETYFLW